MRVIPVIPIYPSDPYPYPSHTQKMSEPPSDQPPLAATTGTTAAGAASPPAGSTGAITSVNPSASATAAAAPAPLSALNAEVLEQRLLSYLGPDERLADWSSSKSLTMSHFRPIIRPNPLPVGHDGATHLCVLCTSKSTARVNLKHTRNATHHLNGKHKTVTTAFIPPAPATPKGSIVDLFNKQLSVQRSPTQSSRSVAIGKASEASQKQQFMLRQHLAKMCFSHQLPYSFTEWEELGACIQDCCLLPSVNVRKFCLRCSRCY